MCVCVCVRVHLTRYLTLGYYPIVVIPDPTNSDVSVIKIITVVYFTVLV